MMLIFNLVPSNLPFQVIWSKNMFSLIKLDSSCRSYIKGYTKVTITPDNYNIKMLVSS